MSRLKISQFHCKNIIRSWSWSENFWKIWVSKKYLMSICQDAKISNVNEAKYWKNQESLFKKIVEVSMGQNIKVNVSKVKIL